MNALMRGTVAGFAALAIAGAPLAAQADWHGGGWHGGGWHGGGWHGAGGMAAVGVRARQSPGRCSAWASAPRWPARCAAAGVLRAAAARVLRPAARLLRAAGLCAGVSAAAAVRLPVSLAIPAAADQPDASGSGGADGGRRRVGRGGPLAAARALGPLVAAAAPRIEASGALPEDVLEALHGAKLFRMLLPRGLGGLELAPASYAAVIETVAAADASTAWCLGQACGCAFAAAYLAPDAARAVFADPRAVLAWGPGPGARAVVVPGGFRLTGEWRFASGCHHAGWLGGHAAIVAEDGTPRGARTLLFPRAAAEIVPVWQVIGLCGTGSDTFRVDRPVRARGFRPAARPAGGTAARCAALSLHHQCDLRVQLRRRGARHRAGDARGAGGTRGGQGAARDGAHAARDAVGAARGGPGRGAAARGAAAAARHAGGRLAGGVRGRADDPARSPGRDPHGGDARDRRGERGSPTPPTTPPAATRCSPQMRSSGGSATSTRWRSRCRRGEPFEAVGRHLMGLPPENPWL